MNNLEKDFLEYQEALGLKELGFDEYCIAYYNELEIRRTGEIILHYTKRGQDLKEFQEAERCHPEYKRYLKEEHCISKIKGQDSVTTLAPTYSQAFRWFREKYKLGAIVAQFGWGIENELGQIIYDISDGKTPSCYEESELDCLKKLIEIVKDEK
jgi:hypothetical protein